MNRKEARAMIAALDAGLARVRATLIMALASEGQILASVEADPDGAAASVAQLEAITAAEIENFAKSLGPAAARYLGEHRGPDEAALAFVRRVAIKVEQLAPTAFAGVIPALKNIEREAQILATRRAA